MNNTFMTKEEYQEYIKNKDKPRFTTDINYNNITCSESSFHFQRNMYNYDQDWRYNKK